MSWQTKIITIAIGVFLLVMVIELLRKRKLDAEYAFLWFLTGIGLIVLAVLHLFHWFNFAVELSDQGIDISGTPLRWEELQSANTKAAIHFSGFSTLIELRSRDGKSYQIPASIQRSLFLLREIQKHLRETNGLCNSRL